jgi:hypothetical protein
MHKSSHLVEVHAWLVTAHTTTNPQAKNQTADYTEHDKRSKPAGKAHLQLLGELANDPLAFLAEEGDDLGNKVLPAPVQEQKLLLELLVRQTITQKNKHKAKNIKFSNTIKLPIT